MKLILEIILQTVRQKTFKQIEYSVVINANIFAVIRSKSFFLFETVIVF